MGGNRLEKKWWCEWCSTVDCYNCKPPIQEGGYIAPPSGFKDKHRDD